MKKKIERKDYKNPLEDIEDICGVRIVCYYQSDVEKIKNIIDAEFDVIDNFKKEEKLEFDQFGYRSTHFIIKIKKQWLNAPNYRSLENLKAELQIRTVLMHAWAEIEHKLAYKSESQIPKEFRRKLSRISAKLEESDEQFEDIKNQIESNKATLINSANLHEEFDTSVEFNLDTLQAFLDYAFPDRGKDIELTRNLFDQMIQYNLNLKTLALGLEKSKVIIHELEKEMIKREWKTERPNGKLWVQVGNARVILCLIDENFAQKNNIDDELIKKHRDLLKNIG